MKKSVLFTILIVLLYSGCTQKGNSLAENSVINTESIERGRIVNQKKVLIAKDQVNSLFKKAEPSRKSSNKNVNLVELALLVGGSVVNAATSKNEVEAYEIQIETNSKIFKTYVDYDFSLGTMIDFTAKADGTITNVYAKYLYK